MNRHTGHLFGRIIVLLVFCAPFFITNTFIKQYRAVCAEELAYQFLNEASENGLTESAYNSFTKEEAMFGYTVTLTIEGIKRSYTDDEIANIITETPTTLVKYDFATCTLIAKDHIIRIGGIRQ